MQNFQNIGDSPSGKATDSDSVIRVFESLIPSHKKSTPNGVLFALMMKCGTFSLKRKAFFITWLVS